MQGLNAILDSTYIQNTNQNIDTPKVNETSENSVSFLTMVKNEIRSNEVSHSFEFVQKTDTDVLKSSSENNVNNTAKVSENNTDVQKTQENKISEKSNDSQNENVASAKDEKSSKDDKSEKAEKTSKSQNAETASNRIKELKNIVDNEKLKSMMKDNSEEKLVLASEKLKLFNEKGEEVSLDSLNQNTKNLKTDKDADDLLASNVLSSGNVFAMSEKSEKISDKANLTKENPNKIAAKKDVKKLSDVISVTDLRTQKPEAAVEKKGNFVTSVKQTSNDSVQVTMDLSSQAEKNILSLDAQTAGAQGSTFQAMLENQISENAADFVKAGNIVLKDNNVGNINLILRPENLGNVKISLELSDNVITGKILVSSQEAFNAFSSTQDSLKAAFIESGFDTAGFDVAFANQNQNFAGNGQEQNQNQNDYHAFNTYGNFVVENSSVSDLNSEIYNEARDYSINIVA
ncbi:MAG: flagellar hook-length control protein FliK [Treponema sp.]|nr:flagellar hook-length control protein FliK [Candidatus Treponema scatequi]